MKKHQFLPFVLCGFCFMWSGFLTLHAQNVPYSAELDDSTYVEFQEETPDGELLYYTTYNVSAAQTISTHQVWNGGGLNLNLSGTNITIGEWDAGGIRLSHQEFGGRVTQVDMPSSSHYHANHVAGTMVASGVQATAKGMAYAAHLEAYDWKNDETEMELFASSGGLLSNHSYGLIGGWQYGFPVNGAWNWWGNPNISSTEDYKFGFYDQQAKEWDDIAYNNPYYLPIKAAGNDRDDNGPANGANHYYPSGGVWVASTDNREADGQYDCIAGAGVSKNVLTVGAVDDLVNAYNNPTDVVMSDFSSWGPTDDGRIKPDIVANGVGVISTDHNADDDYRTLSGTSMAAPSVTGSLALLQEHYHNVTNTYLKAATLKALALHTADEAGTAEGPDYSFGWGLLNTAMAAQTISNHEAANKTIMEETLNDGDSYTLQVESDGTQPLMATISWTDVAGTPVGASLDPTNVMLVNDLDIRLTNCADQSVVFPYVLDPANPANPANKGDNSRDNVEKIYLEAPEAGQYTLSVSHKGSLQGGDQAFGLIVTGANSTTESQSLDASFSYATNGKSVDFRANTSDAETYSWDFGDENRSTRQNVMRIYQTGGTYQVCLAINNECISKTSCQDVMVDNFIDCVEDSWRQYLNGQDVNALLEVGDELFVGTCTGGLMKINQVTNEMVFYNIANSDLPHNKVRALLKSRNGEVFVGTNNGLAKFDGNSPTGWTLFTTYNSELISNSIGTLWEDDNGEIFVGTAHGLMKFDGYSYTNWIVYDGTIGIGFGLYSYNRCTPSLFSLLSADDAIFVGTDNGLIKLDVNNSLSEVVYNTDNSELPNNRIYTLLEKDGEIFVGTNNGLVKFDGSSPTGWTLYNTDNSELPNNRIYTLLEKDGEVFVGTANGLAKFDGNIHIGWTIYNTDNSDLPSNQVSTLLKNSNNQIYIGTNNGLAKFDGNSFIGWDVQRTSNSDMAYGTVNALLESSSGEIFIGTGINNGSNFGLGLRKFDGNSPTGWVVFDTSNSEIPGNYITALLESSSGEIFVGSMDGLAKFDGSSETGWTAYNNHYITALLESSSGEIFAGTEGLLLKLDNSSATTWTTYSKNTTVLLESSNGEILVGGSDGLSIFDNSNSSTWTTYNTSNSNLPSNYVTALLEVDGEIFVGTSNGFGKLDGVNLDNWETIGNYNIAYLTEGSNSEIFALLGAGSSNKALVKFKLENNIWVKYEINFVDMSYYSITFPAYNPFNGLLHTSNNELFIGGANGLQVIKTANTSSVVSAFTFAPNICANTSTTFTNTSQNATTYEWQIDGTTIATTTDLTHTFPQSGTYIVTLIASNGGECEESYSQSITVQGDANDLDLGDDLVICDATEVTLTANVNGAQWYFWDYQGSLVGDGTNQSITVSQAGTYNLSVWDHCNNTAFDNITISFGDPLIVDLGSDIVSCATSETLDAGTFANATYEWSTGETTQTITVTAVSTSSTVYQVTVTDEEGCAGSDYTTVTFDCECVWPGDANYDGVVNNYDLLAIGLAHDFSGPVRSEMDINWSAHYGDLWADYFNTGYNYKHADCDGDGLVTNEDPLAISANYGDTHVIKNDGNNENSNPVASIDLQPTIVSCENLPNSSGHQIMMNINVSDQQTGGDLALYGLAFTVLYPPGLVTDIQMGFADSWLGTENVDMQTLVHDHGDGRLDVALSRINHMNQTGNGVVSCIIATVQDVPTDDPEELNFTIDVAGGVLSDGSIIEIIGETANTNAPFAESSFTVPDDICPNETTIFENNSNNTFTQEWRIDGDVVSIEEDLSYVFTQGGSYTLTLITNEGTACASTEEAVVEVHNDASIVMAQNPSATSCAESVTLYIDGIAAGAVYEWSTNETGLSITVTESGTYSVTITSQDGCSNSLDVDVYLSDDCVLSGDVNTDGCVNYLDLLTMGQGYGKSGEICSPILTDQDCTLRPCPDWDNDYVDNTYGTINCKHFDANGDGTVDNQADPQIIQRNYGCAKEEGNCGNNSRLFANNSTITLRPYIVTDPTAANNYTMEVDLYLEHAQNMPIDVYGIGFILHYSDIAANAQINFEDSWFASTDMMQVIKDFPEQGQIEIGLSQIDGADRTGLGKIARLTAQIQSENDTTIVVATSGVVTIDHEGEWEEPNGDFTNAIEVQSTPLTQLQLTAHLEGAFDPMMGEMHHSLRDQNLLPIHQPFNTAPWNYDGNESVLHLQDLPTNMVDWVLIEIRDEQEQIVQQKAAILLTTGQIVDIRYHLSGINLGIAGLLNTNRYQVILRHRNHLDIASQLQTVTNFALTVDLSQPATIVGGADQVIHLGNGKYGLTTGDFDGNGVISVRDFNLFSQELAQPNPYSNCDADLDGNVLTNDFNYYQPNASKIGVSLIRY